MEVVLIAHILLLKEAAFLVVKRYFETNKVRFKTGGSEDSERKGLCVPLKLVGLDRNEPALQVVSGSRGGGCASSLAPVEPATPAGGVPRAALP